ncbi:L-type lectin-domain containing receptor kinase V.9-like [Hibiscus syriacus]|uniref:L-type lectin-domain containing receptor kinase V.9-like n=1 Tax=Hibiscus syriacus TaxID=106335 RepID=UPI001925117E|nr:L-type lectin-domain containing receptor kinase V.9-like [Hibiscus syriacus]
MAVQATSSSATSVSIVVISLSPLNVTSCAIVWLESSTPGFAGRSSPLSGRNFRWSLQSLWISRPLPPPWCFSPKYGIDATFTFTTVVFCRGNTWLPQVEPCRWLKPPMGYVKLNVDGACPLDTSSLAVMAILRDSNGFLLAGRASCIEGPHDAGYVEAQAICFGFRFAVELGYSQGKLYDGREIAVKKLSHSSNQGEREFENETRLLARVHHRNVLNNGYPLFPYEKILVYEFITDESLDKLLFNKFP